MEPFDERYWSRLQVELWVCTRSKDAVRLADPPPGSIRFADLSLGPDNIDDKKYDAAGPPVFHDDDELFCTAITSYGCICSREDARKEVIVALSERRLCAYSDYAVGNQRDEFFKRAIVLELWPEASVIGLFLTPPENADESSVPRRKGGRSALWTKPLKAYLSLRLKKGDDILSMNLKDLRVDFLSYATRNQIRNVPKARSSLDEQIKRVRPQVVAERQQRDREPVPPLAEIMRVPEIGPK